MKVNKKTFKLVIGIILAIVLVVVGIVVANVVSTNMKISNTQNKLSQINAEDLETKLIEELNKTKFNIGAVSGIKSVNIKEIDGYVSVFVNGEGNFDFVSIPVFKIDSDNSGNFKGIEYIPVFYFGEYIDIESIIFNVLENEYDMPKLSYSDKEKFSIHNKSTIDFTFTYDDTLLKYINAISTRTDYQNLEELDRDTKGYNKTSYFGIIENK